MKRRMRGGGGMMDEDMMMESPLRVMQHLDVPGMAVEEEENDAFDSE